VDTRQIGKSLLAQALGSAQFAQISGEALANIIHRQRNTPMQPIRLQTISDIPLDLPVLVRLHDVTYRMQMVDQMPHGTRHTMTGILLTGRRGFELHVDGGGVWALDVLSWRKARRMLGCQVTVEGTRAGFDLLDVQTMWTGARRPVSASSWVRRLFG